MDFLTVLIIVLVVGGVAAIAQGNSIARKQKGLAARINAERGFESAGVLVTPFSRCPHCRAIP